MTKFTTIDYIEIKLVPYKLVEAPGYREFQVRIVVDGIEFGSRRVIIDDEDDLKSKFDLYMEYITKQMKSLILEKRLLDD